MPGEGFPLRDKVRERGSLTSSPPGGQLLLWPQPGPLPGICRALTHPSQDLLLSHLGRLLTLFPLPPQSHSLSALPCFPDIGRFLFPELV